MELAGMEMTEVEPAGMTPAAMESVGTESASMMHAALCVGLRNAGSERLSTSFWTSRANWQIGERSERVVHR